MPYFVEGSKSQRVKELRGQGVKIQATLASKLKRLLSAFFPHLTSPLYSPVPLLSIHLDLRCLTFDLSRATQGEVIAVNAGDSAVVVVWLFGREVKRRPVSAADHQKVNSWRSQQWIQNPIFEFNV